MGLKKMKISSWLKGGIYEVSFGYNPKMKGYATLMSDIPELYAITKEEHLVAQKIEIERRLIE